MKLSSRTPYNSALAFLMLMALWGIVNFFSYQIAPLPERMPAAILKVLETDSRPGERIYLADQRFDQFVGSHPQFNIFPGSGKNAVRAAEDAQFYLIGGTELRNDFAALKGFTNREMISAEGVTLWRFDKEGAQFAEYRLSDSFPDGLQVRSSVYLEDIPFRNRLFVTGRDSWQNVQVKEGDFGKRTLTALAAHPLDGLDKWVEITVDPARWRAATLVFEYGIANSGDCKGSCQPVQITVTQGDRIVPLESKDAQWQSRPLDGFVADKPLAIRIVAPQAGRRHFFFDLLFRVPVTGGAR